MFRRPDVLVAYHAERCFIGQPGKSLFSSHGISGVAHLVHFALGQNLNPASEEMTSDSRLLTCKVRLKFVIFCTTITLDWKILYPVLHEIPYLNLSG
jgi:hypothetical protein